MSCYKHYETNPQTSPGDDGEGSGETTVGKEERSIIPILQTEKWKEDLKILLK